MLRSRLRLAVPWDARTHWLETILLPLLSIASGWSLIVVEYLVVRRAIPSVAAVWWAIPLAGIVLLFSTYLGALQYYLALPYSLRMLELVALLSVGAAAALQRVHHLGDLGLSLAIVVGAWVLSMHFSFHLYRVWPQLTPARADGPLHSLVERANSTALASSAENYSSFSASYRHLLMVMGKVFLGSILMASLIRPALPEAPSVKLAAAAAMGLFALSASAALATTSVLAVNRESASGRIATSPFLPQRWLSGFAALLIPVVLLAAAIPSGISPLASPDLAGVTARLNGAMVVVTDAFGAVLFAPQPPSGAEGTPTLPNLTGDKAQSLARKLEAFVSDPSVRDAIWSAQKGLSVLFIIALIAFTLVVGWGVIRVVFGALNFVRRNQLRLPPFPLREFLALLLWPIALYRLVRWLLMTLSKALASWLSGAVRQADDQKRVTVADLARMFGLYSQAITGIPKDPAAFIRFIFARLVGLARRYSDTSGRAATATEYGLALDRRFPSIGEYVRQIRQAYERVRYGSKPIDEHAARAVHEAFSAVKKGIRKDPLREEHLPR